MKKEIIVNASKDRSRIAIVEDGELVELYVEHPDNVRTLGNIYLAKVRKVMPAIRAAFVDIGQKQDAFLHFSDLTDNLGELLALSGEKVPGQKARVLSHAPRKRVADDENEPDVEETLELETSEDSEESASLRSRRSSSSRGRSRGRRGNRARREEEEEQEEVSGAGGGSAFVIDLTSRPKRADKPSLMDRTPNMEGAEQPKGSASETEELTQLDSKSEPGNHPSEPKLEPPRRIGQIDLTRAASSTPSTDGEAPGSEPGIRGYDDDDSDDQRPRRRGRRGGRRRNRSLDNGPLDEEDQEASDQEIEDSEPDGRESRGEDENRKESRFSPSRRPPSPRRETTPSLTAESAEGRSGDSKNDGLAEEPRRERESARGGRGRLHERSEGETGRGQKHSGRSSTRNEQRASDDTPFVRPEELLKRDQRLIVKVTKEPISSKGSRVSTDISFAGRFLVLVPAADYVAVSKKIESGRERRRLRTLATSLRPEGFGIIVRTVAEGRDAKTLDTDIRLLVEKWQKIESQLDAMPQPPTLLYEDVNMVSSIIRDLFTEDFDRILVDDPKLHRNIKAYVGAVAPHMADRVKLHRSNAPLFRAVGIERAVEEVFSSRVPLRSGGYLFIEHTEAMHVVDVNSGRAGKGKTQAENLLSVNLEAAIEVARQIRLRDLGGIIVIDFIDMWQDSDKRKVFQTIKREFEKDRAVTKLLPMSDFGLIQITRQRLRPSITATDSDGSDPASAMAAAGASEIAQPERDFGPERLDQPITSEDVVLRLDDWLRSYKANVSERYRDRPIQVRVHPLFRNYLRKGLLNQIRSWKWSLRGLKLDFIEDTAIHPLDFDVRDQKSGKSLTSRYKQKDEIEPLSPTDP